MIAKDILEEGLETNKMITKHFIFVRTTRMLELVEEELRIGNQSFLPLQELRDLLADQIRTIWGARSW